MLKAVENLLRGAIDVHCHGYPELALDWPAPDEDAVWMERAREIGMRGVVLKSHIWPTMGRAYLLRRLVPGFEIFGSITLNPSTGGLSPWAVEAAARLGARVVWLPTWGSRNDIQRGGFSRTIRRMYSQYQESQGLTIIDEDGGVKPEVVSILQVAKDHDLVLFTGHVGAEETIALAREASRVGFGKLVFGHPNTPSVGATLDQVKEAAALGAWVEVCFNGTMPRLHRFNPEQLAEIVTEIGPGRCILSTDVFYGWCSPEPDMMRLCLGTMLDLGLSEESLMTMVQENPARLLSMDVEPESGVNC